jgi:hypothetical protein
MTIMVNFAEIAGKTIRLILLYLKNFSLNFSRRLVILGKKVGIFWQNRRMATQFRRLGENVYARLAAGDVNPLLQDEVKDQLNSLLALEENIAGRLNVIVQIREQIKATSYRLTPPPAPSEPEPKPDLSVDQ